MKKVTTLFFVILCCITILKAEEVALTVHVETPGTLVDKIFDAGQRPALVTKLTVTGTLNDDDFTCMRETMISLVDVDLSSITNTSGVNFKEKDNLVKIILPENLTSIGNSAFYSCDALTSITIGNSVTSIGDHAFYWCDALTSITIPNSVTSIGEDAFYWCDALTSITIGNSVNSIGYSAFFRCDALTEIHISDIAKWCDIDFKGSSSNPFNNNQKVCLYVNGNKITDLVIPEGVNSIKDYAFEDYSSLTSITIPNSVTSIGNWAFSSCDALTSITIGNSVTSIGNHAFYWCNALTSITCLGSTPPEASDLGAPTSTCTLIVPKVAYSSYLRHDYWGQFLNIETIDVDYKKLTVIANNAEWGVVEGGGYYDNGKTATLTAIANSGYRFTQWSDEVTDNPRTVVVTQDSTFTAIFEANSFAITTAVNDDAMGSVTEGGEYAYGTEITLTATANEGYRFAQWSDGNTDNPRIITVTENKTYTAEFEVQTYTITTAAAVPSMGGVEVILNAKPIEGLVFDHWSDGNTENPRTLTLTEDIELYAYFKVAEATNVETSKISSANIYATNGTLHVENATENYHILDAAGRLIYSGNASTLTLPRGIYLVTMGGEVEKIAL
ncbi:MAG: leucine-rich repeat protein [Paludibacteraceae bacterium]|nr:leucine-rich repeat protein [Paludibacteraceae bacterium]